MIKKEDFVWTIGFDGDAAIVDKRSRASYGRLSMEELLNKGLLKPAFSTAYYEFLANDNNSQLELFIKLINEKLNTTFKDLKELKMLFGVQEEQVKRVIAL